MKRDQNLLLIFCSPPRESPSNDAVRQWSLRSIDRYYMLYTWAHDGPSIEMSSQGNCCPFTSHWNILSLPSTTFPLSSRTSSHFALNSTLEHISSHQLALLPLLLSPCSLSASTSSLVPCPFDHKYWSPITSLTDHQNASLYSSCTCELFIWRVSLFLSSSFPSPCPSPCP